MESYRCKWSGNIEYRPSGIDKWSGWPESTSYTDRPVYGSSTQTKCIYCNKFLDGSYVHRCNEIVKEVKKENGDMKKIITQTKE